MARRPSWRLAAVVLVGLLGVTVVASLRDDDEPPREEAEGPAVDDFLEAWSRSRAATFRTVADFTRTSNSTGAQLRGQVIVAQRPPDRLRIDRTGATGLVDGRRLTCGYRRGELDCDSVRAAVTYDEEVADQLGSLEGYVRGSVPLYEVVAQPDAAEGDCFELRLAQRIVAPPLGVVSRYCFDPETGAPTLTHLEAVEAVDDVRTTQLSDEVDDAHLDPATAMN
jgi:hypothetical protein